MEKISFVLYCISAICGIVIPLYFWFKNPELSHMEIFRDFWVLYLLSLVIGMIILKKL